MPVSHLAAELGASAPWSATLSHTLAGADGLSQHVTTTGEWAVRLIAFSHGVTRPRTDQAVVVPVTGMTSLVDGHHPVAVGLRATAHRVEVGGHDAGRHGTDATVTHGTVIDRGHRRDLRARAAEEDLVSDVQLAAVDAAQPRIRAPARAWPAR